MVREALFNILGDEVVGARVVDLFAGAGTVGFEALSRGARRACSSSTATSARSPTCAPPRETSAAARPAAASSAPTRCAGCASRPAELAAATLVFVDAPYRDDAVVEVLDVLGDAPPPVVVCEHHRARSLPDRIGGLAVVRRGHYGITDLTVFRPAVEEEVTGA